MNRTLILSLAATLVLTGGAAAQYANDDATSAAATNDHARLRLEPSEIWLRAGQETHARLGAQSGAAQVLSVSLDGATPPVRAKLSADTINVSPERWDDHVDIAFTSDAVPQRADETLTITIASTTGETRTLAVIVHAIPAEPAAHAPRPAPTAREMPNQTWAMGFSPARIEAKPGETILAPLYAKANANRTVALSVRGSANASLANASLDLAPGAPASDAVTFRVPDDAHGAIALVVDGVDAAGEHHDARLTIRVATAPPHPEPGPEPNDLVRALDAYLRERGLSGHKVVVLVVDEGGNVTSLDPQARP